MPLPDRIKAIIDANVPPAMRDYYYRMVQKESSGRPDLTSPTGAKGLLQFTKGTGRAYGLLGKEGDKRADPDANIKAGVRLTEDNRRTLAKMLGRDPTFSELALAHQQGAETAARMISGVGNASPNALAVNRVDPNASPQAAANKIMAYYGFGDQKAPPGMSLAYNPVVPPVMQPAAPGVAATPFPPPPPVPAAEPTLLSKLLGEDMKGGKGTPFADITSGLEGILGGGGKTAAAAPKTLQLEPSSPDLSANLGGQNMQTAQSLMAAILQNRRKPYGMTLTG